jgi:hypothetical protein
MRREQVLARRRRACAGLVAVAPARRLAPRISTSSGDANILDSIRGIQGTIGGVGLETYRETWHMRRATGLASR